MKRGVAQVWVGASKALLRESGACFFELVFALRRLDNIQSNDIYEVVIERHRRSSTILTSNRHVEEWIPLFDDPILAQSALDRLSHNAYQVPMEGDSYRKGLRPDILDAKSKTPITNESEPS